MWAWTVPDLFPGAVRQGLVAETTSWATAAKLAILLALLAGLGTGGHGRSSGREPTTRSSRTSKRDRHGFPVSRFPFRYLGLDIAPMSL